MFYAICNFQVDEKVMKSGGRLSPSLSDNSIKNRDFLGLSNFLSMNVLSKVLSVRKNIGESR